MLAIATISAAPLSARAQEPSWRTSFFGDNETYARLAAIKGEVDPTHLLCCRNCVGYGDDSRCGGGGGGGQGGAGGAWSLEP